MLGLEIQTGQKKLFFYYFLFFIIFYFLLFSVIIIPTRPGLDLALGLAKNHKKISWALFENSGSIIQHLIQLILFYLIRNLIQNRQHVKIINDSQNKILFFTVSRWTAWIFFICTHIINKIYLDKISQVGKVIMALLSTWQNFPNIMTTFPREKLSAHPKRCVCTPNINKNALKACFIWLLNKITAEEFPSPQNWDELAGLY